MKIKQLFLAALTIFAGGAFMACEPQEEDLGMANLEILSDTSITFEKEDNGKPVTGAIEFKATRDWTLTAACEGDWISFSKEKGKGSSSSIKVDVTALVNAGPDREGTITLSLNSGAAGNLSKTIAVTQNGSGSATIYKNDFDKEKAVQVSNKWPDLKSTAWQNESGSGISTVSYSSTGTVTVRSNGKPSNDNGYSFYTGSGVNRLWMGTGVPSLTVRDITLPEDRNYRISFGAERYEVKGEGIEVDNTFNHEEFHIYISADNEKWVDVPYTFASGSDPVGKWDLGTADITLPAGIDKLSVCFYSSYPSAYALDDISLKLSSKQGMAVDFAKGTTLDTGTITGGDVKPAYEEGDVVSCATIADFIAKEDSPTAFYRVMGTVTKIYSDSGSLDIKDNSGSIEIYKATNFSAITNIAVNATVVAVGHKSTFQKNETTTIVEMTGAYIESCIPDDTQGGGGDANVIYEMDFTKGNLGEWTEDYKVKADGVSKVWYIDPKQTFAGVMSSAYVEGDPDGGPFRVVESWLVSPEIDLSEESKAVLSFTHACNKFASVDVLTTQCLLFIKKGEGEFQQVTIPTMPSSLSWNFVSSGDIDLKDYVGSKIKLAFCYKSLSTSAGTWEIENVKIKKDGGSTVVVDGNKITVTTNSGSQTWSEVTDPTYKAGYEAVSSGVIIGVYENKSDTKRQSAQLNASHIRAYQGGAITIELSDGKPIRQVILTCTSDAKTPSVVNTETGSVVSGDLKVTWTGESSKVVILPGYAIWFSQVTVIY